MPTTRPSAAGGRRAPPSTENSSLAPLTRPTPLDRTMSRDDTFLSPQLKKAATFDKRVSRDDMYLGSHPSAARSAAFHIPLRIQPATIGEGPDLRTAPPSLDICNTLLLGDAQIGMALGSPCHPPTVDQSRSLRQQQQHRHQQEREQLPGQSAPYVSRQPSAVAHHKQLSSEFSSGSKNWPAPPPSKPTSPPSSSMQRSKSTRRKLFGFFGSKRQADPVKPALPAPSARNSPDASDGPPTVMTSALAGSSANPPMSQNQVSPPTTLERSTTRGKNRKHQPILIPAEADFSATSTSVASSSAASTPLVDAPLGATGATGLKSSPSTRGRRPFLRSKVSEQAMPKRPEIVGPNHAAEANRSTSSLGPSRTTQVGSSLAPAAAASNSCLPRTALGTGPFLNVEIPEASMERYSVMFGGLLNCGPSASSLLARRQATLDKLKNINDRMYHDELERSHANAVAADAYLQVGGLQRRATSPHFPRSPSFSLFPSKSPGAGSNHQHSMSVSTDARSPRLRSNTSPAVTYSPMQAEFDVQKHPYQRHVQTLRENPTGLAHKVSKPSHLGLAMATMPSPASSFAARSAVYFDPDQSSLILDSPTEMTAPVDDKHAWKEVTQELPSSKPVIEEPQWQMITPSSSGSSSSSGSRGSESAASKLADRGKDSAASSPDYSISAELQVDEPDSALKSAVESSIARQISVSRQQRDMLRPLRAGSARRAAPSAPTLPRSATLKLSRNEWQQETQSVTPAVVVPPETTANYSYGSSKDACSPALVQRPGSDDCDVQSDHYLSPRFNANGAGSLPSFKIAQNRKSERVILEAA